MDYGAITPRSLRSALEYYTGMLPEKICAWRMRHGLPVAMATVILHKCCRVKPLTGAPDAAIGEAPRTAAEVEGYAMAFAMLPNLTVYSQTNPGQPLVQRVTYRVNKTVDDRVLVTVVDFPGLRNLR
jgi:hypothetical protein